MANIALNKYATESDYENDSTRPTDISTVSLVTGTDTIHYDGVNVKRLPGVVPQVGDALYVDGDGNKFFYSGKSLKASSVPAGQTFLGVVANRDGRKVWVLNVDETAQRLVNPCLHRISAWTVGTAITFKAYKSDWSAMENVTTTFTPTQSDVAGFTAELSTFLKAHQPDVQADSGFSGAKYDWHAEVMPGPDGEDACYVVSDTYTNYHQTENIVASGATCDYGVADMTEIGSTLERMDGVLTTYCGWNKERLAEYLHTATSNIGTVTDSLSSTGILTEDNFNGDSYPTIKAYYVTFDKYLDAMMMKVPATSGMANSVAGKGKEYTEAMASRTCKKIDGTTDWVVYPAAAQAYGIGVSGAEGVEPGDWYMPDFYEAFVIFSKMKVDGTDAVNSTFDKVNHSYVRSLSAYRWVPARYGNNNAWLLYSYGGSYYSYFDNSYRAVAVALLEF